MILTYIKLARAFNQSDAFAVGLAFLNIVFMAILAFGKSEYVGVANNNSNNLYSYDNTDNMNNENETKAAINENK